MSSELRTELLETAAATQPIPTLAKVKRRVCISGDTKSGETKKSALKGSASTQFSQEKKKKPYRFIAFLKYIVENYTMAGSIEQLTMRKM